MMLRVDQPGLSSRQLDRAVGTLVACAVGDALGSGYQSELPPDPELVKMRPNEFDTRPSRLGAPSLRS